MYCVQLGSLVNRTSGKPQPGKEELVKKWHWDTLGTLQEFCQSTGKAKPFCAAPDPITFLPTGPDFHRAVWEMLKSDFQGTSPLSGTVGLPCQIPLHFKNLLRILLCFV